MIFITFLVLGSEGSWNEKNDKMEFSGEYEEEKGFVILLPDTIIYPYAVMIEFLYTAIAYTAVLAF